MDITRKIFVIGHISKNRGKEKQETIITRRKKSTSFTSSGRKKGSLAAKDERVAKEEAIEVKVDLSTSDFA
jgi:hypothetical protein